MVWYKFSETTYFNVHLEKGGTKVLKLGEMSGGDFLLAMIWRKPQDQTPVAVNARSNVRSILGKPKPVCNDL